jgi:hypothetical protein
VDNGVERLRETPSDLCTTAVDNHGCRLIVAAIIAFDQALMFAQWVNITVVKVPL